MTQTGMNQRLPRAGQQSGIGLIEVLIAVLVLAIGLLGLGALQVAGLQQNTNASSRTQATFLAEDIIERARANRQNIGDYGGIDVATSENCDTGWAPDGGGVSANDIAEWRNAVACLLPRSSAQVTVADSTMDVTLTWRDRSEEEDGTRSLTIRAQI